MGRVILQFSISLDGFVAGPDVSEAHPMGVGGERLHDWMFTSDPARAAPQQLSHVYPTDDEARSRLDIGAVVLGNRTFEVGHKLWRDTPYPAPSFVVTHRARAPLAMTSAAFTFVTGGVEPAVEMAKAAAGGRDVVVMGAETARSVLRAGLADGIQLQLVPMLMGTGARLFDEFAGAPVMLRRERIVPTAAVTHLDFGIVR